MILDWDVAHPLMQYIRDLASIRIVKAVRPSSRPRARPS